MVDSIIVAHPSLSLLRAAVFPSGQHPYLRIKIIIQFAVLKNVILLFWLLCNRYIDTWSKNCFQRFCKNLEKELQRAAARQNRTNGLEEKTEKHFWIELQKKIKILKLGPNL